MECHNDSEGAKEELGYRGCHGCDNSAFRGSMKADHSVCSLGKEFLKKNTSTRSAREKTARIPYYEN